MTEILTQDNIPLRYVIRGTGPTIVFVLGYAMTLDEWPGKLISTLASSFRVIVYNHRGVSGAMNPSVTFTIPQGARDLHDLVTQLADGPVHIVGYSMGGSIGLEYAIRYPDYVDRLVLISSDCGGSECIPREDRITEEMGRELPDIHAYLERAGRLLLTESYRNEHPDPMSWFVDHGDVADPRSVMQQYDALATWEGVYSELHLINRPVLVITGDRDIVTPSQNSTILANAIPGAGLVVVEETAHGIIFQEPVTVGEIISRFLKKSGNNQGHVV
ncbi:MAG: alpha/beta hydrolase [Methanospirillum sp.]|uniref:alpha/beta fold hydrolase n=1 Tax=Methanospirillum sp. TaxID=45200 RepID=UPI00236C20E8|nr:alpha/beta hydrolase [Methanospirillum sp.]MDD1729719.1 alpha/beta hydrolase [Methanospirillum sp.]